MSTPITAVEFIIPGCELDQAPSCKQGELF